MLVGGQPVGLRGDPLHTLQGQIRAVVRRRLGERHYHVLAEPQPYEASSRVDWYCTLDGEVRTLSGLAAVERDRKRAELDALLADIERLGQSLEVGATEDVRLAGGFLRLAARSPADDCCYLVGDQPVVIGWGYEVRAITDAGARPVAAHDLAPVEAIATVPPPVPVMPSPVAPTVAAPFTSRFPWFASLVVGFAAIVAALLTAWGLRQIVPEIPPPQVTMLPVPPPPPPVIVFDPMPDLRRAIDAAQGEQGRLTVTLASLRQDLVAKMQQCKPPDLPEDGWKRRDLSVLEGCWVLGHETPAIRRPDNAPPIQGTTTAARLCFAKNGRGTFEISNRFPDGKSDCKGAVSAVYEADSVVRITHPNLPCTPIAGTNTYWVAGSMTCRRADNKQAICTTQRNAEMLFRRAD